MTRINGDRSSVAGVQAADKVQVNPGNPCDDITVTVPAGSADSAILAAADAKSSCHSINTGSRYIDADGDVHNFQSGARTYWRIIRQAPAPPPAPTADYTVTHVRVDGPRNSAQAVKDANKTASGASSGHHEFALDADATTAEILAAADALSTHSITLGSRYIDASGEVHNFRSGKRTYWLITKSEVNVVEPDPDPDPQNVAGNLTLTGTIADQVLTKGKAYTSATAFPEATSLDAGATIIYSVPGLPILPIGITLNSDRKLTGTTQAVLAETEFTYQAADADDTATLTFNLSVLVDYDANDDGLIEVANLAQLNAIRWDLDGDGTASSGNETTYAAAFPNALAGMGCNEDAANDSDKVCIGYELTADLDFDTNGDGKTNAAGDTYWNSGAGWVPIGVLATAFEGNGHTIRNLFVYGPSTNAGLFDGIGTGGGVRNLGLTGLSVTNDSGKSVGGIAGTLTGDARIETSHVTGTVYASGGNSSKAGGLAGSMAGSSQIQKSYAAGSVTASGTHSRAGGLAGTIEGTAQIQHSYATASATASGQNSSAGGLSTFITDTAKVEYSYATGAVKATGNANSKGGLLSGKTGTVTITASYWDTVTTGQSGSPGGVGKTTSELQAPTSAALGIYSTWGTANWDYGTANHYPALKADWDGDGTATALEFGDQLIDYDADDDGLIEVSHLVDLNAIRWDLDGNGAASTGNEATYAAAFPRFQSGMGCNEDETAANDQVCTGYELTADLDFDTNGDGVTNVTGDAYWNSGAGWVPIGGQFSADFDGNGHTISNIFININNSSPDGHGLFDSLGSGGTIKRVGLDGGSVTSVGAGTHNTGGLVGINFGGTIEFSYSSATVSTSGFGGGLVGASSGGGGIIRSSYATGAISGANVGGLVGQMNGASGNAAEISDSYATGAISSTGSGANKNEGGLLNLITLNFPATITNSYSTGGDKLIATKRSNTTVTASYWDSTKGETTASTQGGDPKTTTELQTPTSAEGIYSAWSADKWDFREATKYPALKADFDGDDTATWQEFGDQDPAPAFAADAKIAQVLTAKDVAYTSTTALPEAIGGNLPITYSATGLPAGLTLNADRKITGKPTAYQPFKDVTYTATDADGDTDTLTFKLGVGPAATTLTATAGNGQVTLNWTTISDVSRWGYTQNDGTTTTHPAVPNSSGSTTSYTVSGLTNGTAYTFGVYAIAEVGNDYINGKASNSVTATPLGTIDKKPALGAVTDQLFLQDSAVDFTLPEATGGDGHPNYDYTLTPALPAGLTFTESTRKLTGTPTAPLAKTTYTYKAEESADPDGTTESDSKTFTIGIHAKKPLNFRATPGNTEITLRWTAIDGVNGWRTQIDGGNWFKIPNSDATTNSYTRTGLTNETEYTFKVSAHVGTGDTEVLGVASDAVSVTPSAGVGPGCQRP